MSSLLGLQQYGSDMSDDEDDISTIQTNTANNDDLTQHLKPLPSSSVISTVIESAPPAVPTVSSFSIIV